MNDTLSINIKIDSRIYPLVVSRKEEERYRNAAKRVNELVQAFRNDYPDKDSQDFLAMTAFQVAYSNLVMQEKADESPLLGELKDIRDDVDDFLQEKSASRP
ncbi:MAG: cell division protein ZapA [Prolixibacteraceae bacterium]|jgi:cell division protein ZapA|nr:cell division protein ZapA [Prolixibacteraceae bacterium]MDI9563210.1 cell division protein ZapA [Bacteroidota bacterium]NLS99936.1 cell division protein ZapA [Bacteroidales bacterium]OQB81140.1 MAG: Cell division protein ZapA [Bacteroidetes bacterium ADurb.Bin123]HNU77179.1 cell division protein ZapA [Prolixibacteraceae bacterium]